MTQPPTPETPGLGGAACPAAHAPVGQASRAGWSRAPGREMEPGRTGPLNAGLYLSTWTLEPGTLDALHSGLTALADAVFAPAPA